MHERPSSSLIRVPIMAAVEKASEEEEVFT